MSITVYGIPNCGSVKKARTLLEEKGLNYEFHDYKKLGANEDKLNQWCEEFGWEIVLNKKGQTWRNLDESVKVLVTNKTSAVKLMLKNTSAIKRPIIETENGNLIGFDEKQYIGFF
jgi:arsenate reductase